MKLQTLAIAGLGLSLCSCAIPPAPPPAPPLPVPKQAVSSLTQKDMSLLGQMYEWTLWRISLADLVKTHSNQSVLIQYGAKLAIDYKQQKEAIDNFLKNHSSKLTISLPPVKQKELLVLNKLYGKKFDHSFLIDMNKKQPNIFNNLKNKNQKEKISLDIMNLLNKFCKSEKIYKGQARDILLTE